MTPRLNLRRSCSDSSQRRVLPAIEKEEKKECRKVREESVILSSETKVVSPPPSLKFRMMMGNLQDVRHSLFLYNDALVEGLLRQVYNDVERKGLSCSCFTYRHEERQYIVAQAGTLHLGDHCEACDSVCKHNTVISEILAIGDLTKDTRTNNSELVTAAPYLKSYQGVRLTKELSLIILTSEPLNEEECLFNKKRLAKTTAFLIPLLQDERDDDDRRIRLVIDISNIIVRATLGALIFFDAPNGLVGKNAQDFFKGIDLSASWKEENGMNAFTQYTDVQFSNKKKGNFQLHRYDRVLAIDITDKTAETALELSKYEIEIQRKVLGQIAHELRNKFTAAIDVMENTKDGHHRIADILMNLAIPPPIDNNVDEIKNNILNELQSTARDMTGAIQLLREGNTLIETRLNLHRMIAGTYDTIANSEKIIISDLIDEVAGDSLVYDDKVNNESKIDFQVNGNAAPLAILIDLNVLNHVLKNCITNSMHSLTRTTKRSIIVHALLLKNLDGQNDEYYNSTELRQIKDDQASWLEIRIRDTGAGIPDHLIGKLFSSEALNAHGRGCGLGLPSSALFLQTIHGTIWLESTKINDHSEFRFRIPCRILAAACQSARQQKNSESPLVSERGLHSASPPGHHRRISVADDADYYEFKKNLNAEKNTNTTPPAKDQMNVKKVYVSEVSPTENNMHEQNNILSSLNELHIIEDSTTMRTMIIKKLNKAFTDLGTSTTVIYEYESNESFLEAAAHMPDSLPSANSIITVDHNTGGSLCGSHTIQYLLKKKFAGLIISISGEDAIAKKHIALGAHTALGKPLPPIKKMKSKIINACTSLANYRLASTLAAQIK